MRTLNEYINQSVNEKYTLEDMDKVAKVFADFRKKHPEGTIQSMLGIFISCLYQFVNEKDKRLLKNISDDFERSINND